MFIYIINFIKKLFGISSDIPKEVENLNKDIEASKKKLQEIENEKVSVDDIVDHFNNK